MRNGKSRVPRLGVKTISSARENVLVGQIDLPVFSTLDVLDEVEDWKGQGQELGPVGDAMLIWQVGT